MRRWLGLLVSVWWVVTQPALGAAQALVADAAHAAAARGVVNLNTATLEELDRLPGIGPSRARAILELRARIKRFVRVDDVLRVRGIGRATFRRLRPLLALEGPTTLR